ncbi:ABC transporter substrate-binding protein [Amycolatopsis taiwanensis]|uniref:Amino acid ABC transporter substrate-binding protein n=1 Tax=Amycolatopsis taiwanensis TaxID=342230 RepID=A0A9W6R2P2_9PSEU|nr:amino acid ABC transporter substrate-binding protein [Amycolatopsis taiwanensis]
MKPLRRGLRIAPRNNVRNVVAIVVAVLVTLCSACGSQATPAVRVGTLSDSRPNAYLENGRFTGFDNELLRAAAAKEGLTLEFTATDFSPLLRQVAEGRFDVGSAAISQTEDRKKTLDFSNAYNYQALGVVAPAGTISDDKSLAGKRIGVVGSTISDTWLVANQPTAQVIRFPNDAAVLDALSGRRLDGALFDQANAEHYAADDPALAATKIVDAVIPQGYAVPKGNGAVLTKLNRGLRQVIADGTWVRLHQQFEPNGVVPQEFQGHP